VSSAMDKVWDVLINKAHVAIAVVTQAAILYLDRTGHAITASTQQTVNWFYLFLAGHFGASQLWPDKPVQQDTVVVNNDDKG
jgi:hypothetical protein